MPPIASFNGADLSGTVRPKSPNDGSFWYDQTNRATLVYDANSKIWMPIASSDLYIPFSATAGLIHDTYRASSLRSGSTGFWTVNRGTDTTDAISFAIESYGVGAMTTGNGGTGFASDGVYKVGPSAGTAASVAKRYVERIKTSAITTVSIFMGFTDTAAFEEPMSLSGTTWTTTATDAVGFLFDTAATTVTIRFMAVKNDVDATHVDTGLAYVADTYIELAVEVDTDGTARGYINGTLAGTLSTAVTTSVALYPVLTATARSTSIRKISATLSNVNAVGV
jgi:hypothetical protein